MNYKHFEQKLGSWGPKLKPFIESEEMDKIYSFLKKRKSQGAIICPQHENTFRSFKECNIKDLKAVMVLMDPYPWIKDGLYAADGIPMSCSNTEILQPSLDKFYDGIEEDLYNGLNLNMDRNPDLAYLCNQGVLMLNSSLTTELNRTGAHKELWLSFHKYLFENVLDIFTEIPFIFMGKQAQELIQYTNKNQHILTCEHPAASSYRGGVWKHENIFSEANKILKENNGEEIQWALKIKENLETV